MGLLLTLGFVGVGIRNRRVSAAWVLLAMLALPVGVVLSLLLATLAWWAIRLLDPNLQVMLVGSCGSSWYLAGLLVLGAAGMAAAFRLLCASVTPDCLAAGAVLAFGALAVLVGAVFTPGSYIFVWPLLACLPALAWTLSAPAVRRPDWRPAATLLAVVPATVILLAAGLVGFSALTVRLDSLTGLPVFGLPAVLMILLAGLLLPLIASGIEAAPARGRTLATRVPPGWLPW